MLMRNNHEQHGHSAANLDAEFSVLLRSALAVGIAAVSGLVGGGAFDFSGRGLVSRRSMK